MCDFTVLRPSAGSRVIAQYLPSSDSLMPGAPTEAPHPKIEWLQCRPQDGCALTSAVMWLGFDIACARVQRSDATLHDPPQPLRHLGPLLRSSARTALAMDGLQVGEFAIKVSMAKSNVNDASGTGRPAAVGGKQMPRLSLPSPQSLPPPVGAHRHPTPHADAAAMPNSRADSRDFQDGWRDGRPLQGGRQERSPGNWPQTRHPGPPRTAGPREPPDQRAAASAGRMPEGKAAFRGPDPATASDRDIADFLQLDVRRPSDRRRIDDFRKSGGQLPGQPPPAERGGGSAPPYGSGGGGRQRDVAGAPPQPSPPPRRPDHALHPIAASAAQREIAAPSAGLLPHPQLTASPPFTRLQHATG